MSAMQILNIDLNNVYDFAYAIAQEFEQIVLLYGIDKMKPVIEKVINVLEMLEESIKRIEQLETEVTDLKSNSLYLSSEKLVSDQEKFKLKQMYEETEESWQEEVVNLKSQLSILKSENELLKNNLALKKENLSKSDDKFSEVIQEQEKVIGKLKHIVQQKEKQLQDNLYNVTALNSKIQELLKINKILHLKNQEARNDICKLILEKNDCKSELVVQKKENILLSESIAELLHNNLHKGNERFLHQDSCEYKFEEIPADDTGCYKEQKLNIQEKIKRLQSELQRIKSKPKQYEVNISRLNSDENKGPFSKIHQFFQLFLGVTTLSEFYWL